MEVTIKIDDERLFQELKRDLYQSLYDGLRKEVAEAVRAEIRSSLRDKIRERVAEFAATSKLDDGRTLTEHVDEIINRKRNNAYSNDRGHRLGIVEIVERAAYDYAERLLSREKTEEIVQSFKATLTQKVIERIMGGL